MVERASPSGRVTSVNIGTLVPNPAKGNTTAIDKRPVAVPVWVSDPGVTKGASGFEGDQIGDKRHHGGRLQAVYAFAREDLNWWGEQLGTQLPDGMFGENLTIEGLDPNRALIGEQWRVGEQLLLEVAGPRIPCRTFTDRMGIAGWAKMFTDVGRSGAYFKVISAGSVSADDRITVVHKPKHAVDVTMSFFALTIKPSLLHDIVVAEDDLPEEMRQEARSELEKLSRRPSLA